MTNNYRKKPVDVFAVQVFQKDIEAAFEIEKEEYKKRNDERVVIEGQKDKSRGSLSGTYTTHLVEGAKIYISRSFDKARDREWHINAYIETLEGRMQISDGDYVIRGVKGEHYPCRPDIFDLTYEAI